ncbi:hypothetical protein CMQ_3323 [Grosmannia clavigera kw1407]|uniref:Uncharacterized protein n=1 Tax=Grosmannia clavigera (strain kw1407 / UAMH 11150) TaxID=655863 RepID=F0X8M4_GROCL|nr:uncharacterized protein CMQ_3323 [Grosmannia clavigera kw1407]EFX05254.1 hypothetical protein CMQ_3323 [Grosmannia clavigera kw1407]
MTTAVIYSDIQPSRGRHITIGIRVLRSRTVLGTDGASDWSASGRTCGTTSLPRGSAKTTRYQYSVRGRWCLPERTPSGLYTAKKEAAQARLVVVSDRQQLIHWQKLEEIRDTEYGGRSTSKMPCTRHVQQQEQAALAQIKPSGAVFWARCHWSSSQSKGRRVHDPLVSMSQQTISTDHVQRLWRRMERSVRPPGPGLFDCRAPSCGLLCSAPLAGPHPTGQTAALCRGPARKTQDPETPRPEIRLHSANRTSNPLVRTPANSIHVSNPAIW